MAWNVARLIRLSRDLPIEDVPLSVIAELDEPYWGSSPTTVRDVVEHMRLAQAADTTIPIILCGDGRIMDGMHRVARVLLDGDRTIQARRFAKTPVPDHIGVPPGDLSYHAKDFQI